MHEDEKWMNRTLQLAANGLGHVAPNPMVGCVIVHNNTIIGEGYHKKYGDKHAEVNALESVSDDSLLSQSTLYVNLEPCAHFGKTPPCSQLIIDKKIPRVVIGTIDPNPLVSGKGIQQLKDAGIDVIVDCLKDECTQLNKRFFTFHQDKRPYIILKWAQSKDGFIDSTREQNEKGIRWITCKESLTLTHRWRSQEQAILVGKTTVLNDNPTLTTRKVVGKNPLRIAFDRNFAIPFKAGILNADAPTILIHDRHKTPFEPYPSNIQLLAIDYTGDVITQLTDALYSMNIQSMIVEGGTFTIQQFINAGMWDEARVFTGPENFDRGLSAPELPQNLIRTTESIGPDKLEIFHRV